MVNSDSRQGYCLITLYQLIQEPTYPYKLNKGPRSQGIVKIIKFIKILLISEIKQFEGMMQDKVSML